MGTLSAELGKLTPLSQNAVASMYSLMIMSIQHCLVGIGLGQDEAERQARHMLTRLQGAANLSQTFKSVNLLESEIAVKTYRAVPRSGGMIRPLFAYLKNLAKINTASRHYRYFLRATTAKALPPKTGKMMASPRTKSYPPTFQVRAARDGAKA